VAATERGKARTHGRHGQHVRDFDAPSLLRFSDILCDLMRFEIV
jgi:hypothetical protein